MRGVDGIVVCMKPAPTVVKSRKIWGPRRDLIVERGVKVARESLILAL